MVFGLLKIEVRLMKPSEYGPFVRASSSEKNVRPLPEGFQVTSAQRDLNSRKNGSEGQRSLGMNIHSS